MRQVSLAVFLAIAFGSLLVTGCVERRERVRFHSNGVVEYKVEVESQNFDEIFGPDAVPTAADGWVVRHEEKQDEAGNKAFRFIAEKMFQPHAASPQNFASFGDGDADLYLQFPTTFTAEQRADGTYFHFRRTYPARSWAQIELLHKKLVDEPLEHIKDRDPAEWSDQDRQEVVAAFASFELEKALTFARAAYLQVTPHAPQDAWLMVRSDVMAFVAALDRVKLAALLKPVENPEQETERGKQLTVEAREFEHRLAECLNESLRQSAHYDDLQSRRFKEMFDRARKNYDITSVLAGHRFLITVELPGRIIAHNGQKAQGGEVTFAFEGSMIQDREIELLATSRVSE